MGEKTILYLGDTSLSSAAGYLAGLMTSWGVGFDYLPSDVTMDVATAKVKRKLFILSDYPAKLMSSVVQEAVVQQVNGGAGLLMIGGWESYCGMGGDWGGTAIGKILPVEISRTDDRVNCDQPALLVKSMEHPITAGLPWEKRPPTVGGFNRLSATAEGKVILEVERFSAGIQGGKMQFSSQGRSPMLVVGTHGNGRTAALATDVAPHWVGGLVDWGTGRVTAQAAGSWGIEVGDLYSKFLKQVVYWTGNL